MAAIIETHNLTKTFEKRLGRRRAADPATAVDGVTFSIERGELFGLLGPNGAGKTTLVKMLATLILPSAGSAVVTGHPLAHGAAIRAAVGLVTSDERSFYWRLSARQNLRFFAALHELHGQTAADRAQWALDAVSLGDVADRRFGLLSSGMRQRLAIARSLLHRPQLLFLDEPSRSLDPAATAQLHNLIRRLMADEGLSILLITHNLSEAEALCDRVALMRQGRLQAIGRPDALRRQLLPRRTYTVATGPLAAAAAAALRAAVAGAAISPPHEPTRITFQAAENDGRLTAALSTLHEHGIAIHAIDAAQPSLEEVFAHYTAGAAQSEGSPASKPVFAGAEEVAGTAAVQPTPSSEFRQP